MLKIVIAIVIAVIAWFIYTGAITPKDIQTGADNTIYAVQKGVDVTKEKTGQAVQNDSIIKTVKGGRTNTQNDVNNVINNY